MEPATSSIDLFVLPFSSSKILSLTTRDASLSVIASVSPWVTPKRTSLDKRFGQRLGDVFVDLLQDEFLQLGDGTGTQAVVFHLLRGVVDALQSLADERVLGVVLLYLGVDEVEVVVKLTRLAEKHIFHARLEAVFEPFQATEPYHFDTTRFVAEEPRGTCGSRCPDELDV